MLGCDSSSDGLHGRVYRPYMQHGGTATWIQPVPVVETHEGKTVWEGVVHVFNLAGNPKASRAYAWSSPIEGSTKRRFFAVLHMGAIDSPEKAVRAAIATEFRRTGIWRPTNAPE